MLQTVKYDGIIAYEDSKGGKELDINCLLHFWEKKRHFIVNIKIKTSVISEV